MGTKKPKKYLKRNYDHFDYVCLFELPDDVKADYNEDIVVKVRRYQSSMDFESTQGALIAVYDNNKIVLELYDDGNGLDLSVGERVDYSNWVYLTCALRAYDSDYRFSRKMKKVEV